MIVSIKEHNLLNVSNVCLDHHHNLFMGLGGYGKLDGNVYCMAPGQTVDAQSVHNICIKFDVVS